MNRLLLLAAFLPLVTFSQSKKKRLKAEQDANAAIVANIKANIQYLASDKLEGRRTGTTGEALAMQYIIAQYKQMGIAPKGNEDGYEQEFVINEGKQINNNTFVTVNNKKMLLNKEYFPLSYSANKNAKGDVALALNENGQPWFKDVKEWLEDNQQDPNRNIDVFIKKETEKAAHKGAVALFIYNSSVLTDNVQFNKEDSSQLTKIPVLFITKEGLDKYFSDYAATQNIQLNVSIGNKIRKAHNVVAFINNNAANTIVLGAHFDHLGYGEDNNAMDTEHIIHNGADDNASGTAALLELARLLKQSSSKNNNYLFINFSAGELGLKGSKYWQEHSSSNIIANYMINMDMVGRYDAERKLTVGGFGTSPAWGEVLATITHPDLEIKFDSTGSGLSDHASFYNKNVPVLFFSTGRHPDYHKATDDWDKINFDAEKNIVQYIYKIIQTTDSKGKLLFTKTADKTNS
jgi:hypothetical protein